MTERTSQPPDGSVHTGKVIGGGFTDVLRAAQEGSTEAFVRLWRDANPAMTRYLSVVSSADAQDVACESWVTVLRGLPAFTGSEDEWRSRLFAAARAHAAEVDQREDWALLPGLGIDPALAGEPRPTSRQEPGGRDIVEPETGSRLGTAVAALRGLPRDEAEVLVLRHVGLLGDDAIGATVGADPEAVRTLAGQAEERLGADLAEVLTRLTGPARGVELADEAAVLTLYQAMTGPALAGSAPRGESLDVDEGIVVSLAPIDDATVRPPAFAAPLRPSGAAPGGYPPATKVVALRRTALGAGASVAASAIVLGLGGLSAAAYTGVLPDPVQDVMSRVIGAPPAHEPPDAVASSPATAAPTVAPAPPVSTSGVSSQPALRRPAVPQSAVVGLCREWAAELARGTPPQQSPAFLTLVGAAGGTAKVAAYCANALPPASTTVTERPTVPAQPSAPVTSAPEATTPPPTTDTATPTETTVPPTTETPTMPVPEPTTAPAGKAPHPPAAAGRPAIPGQSTRPSPNPVVEHPRGTGSGSSDQSGRATDRSTPGKGAVQPTSG